MSRPDELAKELLSQIDEAKHAADKLHASYAQGANLLGYASQQLEDIAPSWAGLASQAIGNSEYVPMLESGVMLFRAFNDELRDLQRQSIEIMEQIPSVATSVQTIAANSTINSLTTAQLSLVAVPYTPCPFLPQSSTEATAIRLERLDAALAGTYRQVWASLYGNRDDPERTALWEIRQTFDHLFDILARDEDVRRSPYWTPKSGQNPKQVTREERIEYAANTRIADRRKAAVLAASARGTVAAYQKLNQAHCRDELDKEQATNAVRAMDQIIRDWVDALNL